MTDVLTEREAEVLEGLARRLSYQEIADELFISLHTVKSHADQHLPQARRPQPSAGAAQSPSARLVCLTVATSLLLGNHPFLTRIG